VYNYDYVGTGVRVYIADSGVDGLHTDFETLSGSGVSRVQLGTSIYPPTWAGYPGNTDNFGHGTHVASLVGGLTYGVAKDVTLVPVRILDSGGAGSMQGLLDAMDWIVADAAASNSTRNVINLSIDAGYSTSLENKFAVARAAGFVIVGAAGNHQEDACSRSPGGSSQVLSVGSIAPLPSGTGEGISSFSNFGPCVSLFAPGSEIPGALANSGHDASIIMSGTSMASPVVTGVVALLWSKYPYWSGSAIQKRVLESSVLGAVNFDACAGCGTSTKNLLVQVPTAEILLVSGVDVVFAKADFGSSPALWSRRQAPAAQFGTCASSSGLSVLGKFAVIDFAPCPGSSGYASALQAQTAGAVGVLLVSPDCLQYTGTTTSLPARAAFDAITVPVVCVPSVNAQTLLSGSPSVSLGLPRPDVTSGPAPWQYSSVGSQANEQFTEWRVDWSGTASQQASGAFCFTFTPPVVAGSAPNARIAVALSSDQVLALTAQSPAPQVNRYVARLLNHGPVQLFRNGVSQTSLAQPSLSFSGSQPLYARVGYSSGAWAVELGKVGSPTPLLRFEDSAPLNNINFFSLTSSGSATVSFTNIDVCSSDLAAGLASSSGSRNPHTDPPAGSFGGGPPVATASPTPVLTASPTPAWSAALCNALKRPRACKTRSAGACQWIAKKCYYVVLGR
jgi:hypothetical protein